MTQKVPDRKWVIFCHGETPPQCRVCHAVKDVAFLRMADGVTFCKKCYVDVFEKRLNIIW